MKRVSRKLKKWANTKLRRGLGVKKIYHHDIMKYAALGSYTKTEKQLFLDVFKCCFLKILLNQKEFNISGLGKLRLAFSIGEDHKGLAELCLAIMISDTSVGVSKNVDDGIIQCFDEEELEKAMKELIS